MNKKRFFVLATTLLTALSAVGCGGNKTSSKESSKTHDTSEISSVISSQSSTSSVKSSTSIYDPDESSSKGSITPVKTFADALKYDYSGLYSYSYILYADGEMEEAAYYKEQGGIYAVYDQTYASMGYDDPIVYYASATIKGVKDDYTYWEGKEGKTVAQILDYVTEKYTSIQIKLNGKTTTYTKQQVLDDAALLAKETFDFSVTDQVLYINLDARGNYTYYHSGWVANGYRDADLAMYHAYFSIERMLEYVTVNDVEKILGDYYVKETSLAKINEYVFEFYTTPFAAGVDLTAICFQVDETTGAITKIVGSVSDTSDDGVIIEIYSDAEQKIQAQAQLAGLFADTFPKAPYWKSETDRNVYTYAEMSPTYVPDVWASGLEIKLPADAKVEDGKLLLEIGESIDLNCVVTPSNVNRVELEWIVINDEVADVNYKENTTKFHKYVTGVGKGEAEVYVTAQIEDGKYIKSNKIKVKVAGLAEIDKTNAVYDFDIYGSEFEKLEDGTTDNKNVTLFSAVNNATQTEIKNAPYEIKGHNVKTISTANTDAWNKESGMVVYAQPLSQEYMNNGFYSEMVFDFDDQQVISIDFYWALRFANHRGSFSFIQEAYIATSNDGENWSAPIDMKAEMAKTIDTYNLNYEAFAKIMHRSFAAASKVKIYFKSNHVGGNLDIAMKNFVFKYDSTCNKHSGDVIPVTALAVSVDDTSLKIGETAHANATITPTNASNKNLTWVSSNTGVATIGETGEITAVSAGTTDIYAVAHNSVESNKVTVTVVGQEQLDSKYVGKKFFANSVSNQKGDRASRDIEFVINSATTATLTVKKSGSADDVISFTYWTTEDRYFEFKDASKNILKLKYSSFSNSHEFFYENASYNFKEGNGNAIEVEEYINLTSLSFKIDSTKVTSYEMLDKDTKQFFIEKSPSDATLDVDDVVVTSSNTNALTIVAGEYSGFVLTPKAVSSVTEVTVTATLGDVQAVLTVTVKPTILATAITVTAAGSKTSLTIGETVQLTASTTPSDVNKKNIAWTSTASNIAKVDKNGLVTAVSAGTATIKATDSVSGKVGEISITVTGGSQTTELSGAWTFTFVDTNSENFVCTININSGINKVTSNGTPVGTISCESFDDINLYLDSHTGNTYVLQAYDGNVEFFISVTIDATGNVTSATLNDENYGVYVWTYYYLFEEECDASSIVRG